MARKSPPTSPTEQSTLESQIDSLLSATLAAGWDDEVGDAVAQINTTEVATQPVFPPVRVGFQQVISEYPPLTVRDQKVQREVAQQFAAAVLSVDGAPAFLMTRDGEDGPEPEPEDPVAGIFDIGLLSDIASGRKTASQAAEAMGVSDTQVQSALATALHQIDPKEIAKAMGVQAAEQQLKSGALYGAVIFDLVQDMVAGRLKPELKLDLAKMLAQNGRITPKDDKSVGAGGGFVLNISMGSAPPAPITIDAAD